MQQCHPACSAARGSDAPLPPAAARPPSCRHSLMAWIRPVHAHIQPWFALPGPCWRSYQLEELLAADTGIATDPEVLLCACMVLGGPGCIARGWAERSGVPGRWQGTAAMAGARGWHACPWPGRATPSGGVVPSLHHAAHARQPRSHMWHHACMMQVRVAAEEALETLSVCETCSQVGSCNM